MRYYLAVLLFAACGGNPPPEPSARADTTYSGDSTVLRVPVDTPIVWTEEETAAAAQRQERGEP